MSQPSSPFSKLRSLHPRFIYEDWHWELQKNESTGSDLVLTFDFQLENSQNHDEAIHFHPQVTIQNVTESQIALLPTEVFENFLFNLGMMEIPSYWKAACSPEIVINAGTLDTNQIAWWTELLLKGLGEFFYTNDIDFTQKDFVTLSTRHDEDLPSEKPDFSPATPPPQKTATHSLIPVGGGKDSALTLGVFEKNDIPFACFLLEPHSPAAKAVIENSHPKQVLTARRQIDPKLLELNQAGYMNGHTPFSAYLAFVSSFVGFLFGIEQIVLSNEHSANEGNLIFHNQVINHQYSKTFTFETDFQRYLEKWVYVQEKPHTRYFSFLRPLYEIQISQLFAHYSQYHSIFRSCNVGQKENRWCHHCPKCLFVFVMLFPFLDESFLTTSIFTKNLYEEETLLPLLLELTGKTKQKPLECVGTYEEVKAALFLSIQKYQQASKQLPVLLEKVADDLRDMTQETIDVLLTSWNDEHHLPENLAKILRSELAEQKQ